MKYILKDNNVNFIGSIHVSHLPISPSKKFGGSWKFLYKRINLKYKYGEEFNVNSSIYRYSMQNKLKFIKSYIYSCTNYSLLKNKINKGEKEIFQTLYVWERVK